MTPDGPYLVELRCRGLLIGERRAETIEGLISAYLDLRAGTRPSKSYTFGFFNEELCEMDGTKAVDGLTDDEREQIERCA